MTAQMRPHDPTAEPANETHAAPVCVATGASQGIGLAVADKFLRLGYRVLACGRRRDVLEQAQSTLGAGEDRLAVATLDVADPEQARRAVGEAQRLFGRIDVLVNNAGHAPLAKIEAFPPDAFRQALAVNVEAVFHATQAAWPLMQAQGGGVVINISSLASLDPFPGFSVYGACKAWVNLFTRALGDEGRPWNIRVFAVAPGAVETAMLRGAFPDFPADQTLTPSHVADTIAMLCHESMTPASGQTIAVKK